MTTGETTTNDRFSPSPAQEHILDELLQGARSQREISGEAPDEAEQKYNTQYIRDEAEELVARGFIRRVGENTGVYEITPKGVRWARGIETPAGNAIPADDLKHRSSHIALTAALLSVFDGPFRARDATAFLEDPPHRTTVSKILSQAEMEGWLQRETPQGPYYPGPLARELQKAPEERASFEDIVGSSGVLGEDLY